MNSEGFSVLATGNPKTFRVAFTADLYRADGAPQYRDLGLDVLDADAAIAHGPLAEYRAELTADQLRDANAAIVLAPRVTAASVAEAHDLLAIGRFGVGYDSVDVAACTAADVLLFIAAGAVDRSVAEATVGWMLALTHHVRAKDRLVRAGEWDRRSSYMGGELRDRTLGAIGLGGIARTLVKLLSNFGMKPPLAYDPFVDSAVAASCGVKLVLLDELLSTADFVSVHCPLNADTRNLLGAAQLARMKRDAYLINTARGGIVDEDALYAVLAEGKIAGAAIDCFVGEPVVRPHRFGTFDNVLLAPHAIAWTDELFRDIGRTACRGMVALSRGERPHGVVNPEVFDRPAFLAKWSRLRTAAVN
ncbi:MAG: NAD(P)-dependent oxidoreductase [Pirellulales bacterium]